MTRIKDITFESGSLTGTDGFDSIVGSNASLSTPILKGSYTASVSVTAALSSYGQEDFTATNNVYMSVYVRVSAISTSNFIFCDIRDAGGNTLVRVRITSTGAFRLEVGGTTIGTDYAATVGTMYRIGLVYNKGTGANAVGQMFVAVGDAAFGAAHASTSSSALTAQATRIRCGVTSSGAIVDLVFDNLRIDDATMPAADPTPTASHVMLGGSHMPLMLGIYTAPQNGALLADLTAFAQGVTCTTSEHGFEELSATVPRSFAYAYQLWEPQGRVLYVLLTNGAQIVWCGRLVAPELWSTVEGTGLRITAYGQSHALDDIRHTGLWSDSGLSRWKPGTGNTTDVTAAKFATDTQSRLYCTIQKGVSIANAELGGFSFDNFDSSGISLLGLSFDVQLLLPTSLTFYIQTQTIGKVFIANDVAVAGTGAVITRSYHLVLNANVGRIIMMIYNGSGAAVVPSGETGTNYIKITNVRVVGVTTNRVNTTLIAARANGTNVIASVNSTANMYIGQRLTITSGTNSESVLITALSGNTFTATFVNGPAGTYPIGTTVQAHVVYADDIAKSLITSASALNVGQISSSVALIQSPGLDLADRAYEDKAPSEILNELIALGDNQIPPRQWEWQVWEDGMLAFRPQSTAGASWLVDITELQLQRSLEELVNSVYGVYRDVIGATKRTSASVDNASVAMYGITRQGAISSDSTSAVEALVRRDAAKLDQKDPLPRATLMFANAAQAGGAVWPNALVRAGDTLGIQNLPAELSSSTIDKIRSFRIGATTYDVDADTIKVDPGASINLLEFLLARRASGF